MSVADTERAGARVQTLARLDVYEALDTSPRGFAPEDAARRLAECGPNVLPKAQKQSLFLRFLEQFTDLFAVVLIVASFITFVAYFVQTPHDVGNLQLAIAILGVVLLNAVIGFFQEYSAERTAEALKALVPKASRVIRAGDRIEIPAEELVHGDLVVLEAGDAISCDCRVVEAHDFTVNNVALTGESDPVGRTDEPAGAGTDLMESRHAVFMGTSVVNGTAKAVAFATGQGTEFGIYQLTAAVSEEKSPLQREVAIMAKRVSAAAIAIGALLFALRAGTGNALVATTGDDEDNLVVSLLAKRQFDVPRVVARNNYPENRWLFSERWGVDVAVSAAATLLSLIQEATGSTETVDLIQLGRAGVRMLETTISESSIAVGKTLAEVSLPEGTVIAAVVRDGVPHVPGGSFRLDAGDEVLVVSEAATDADVRAAFQRTVR